MVVKISVFIDSSMLIACANGGDIHHETAVRLIKQIEEGVYGEAFISDYVFDETVTVIAARLKDKQEAVAFGRQLLQSPYIILRISPALFEEAWHIFSAERQLSFTDATSVACMKMFHIPSIASFDTDFQTIAGVRMIHT